MIIEYDQIREGKAPTRSNPSDAGMDLYWNPLKKYEHQIGFQNGRRSMEEGLLIRPNDSVLLETACKIAIPHGYFLRVENRSSIASKRNLIVGANIIDAGYKAEIKINLINVGANSEILHAGDKIAQLVMYPIIHFRLRQNENLFDDLPVISSRGEGGFGSTGT